MHAANCPNVRRLLFTPEREVEVEWGGEAGVYAVPLHVSFEERQGMLTAISQAATGENADIKSCHLATGDDRSGVADLVVEIEDRGHLDRVMVALRRVAGVLLVESESGSQVRRLRAL